MPSSAESRCNSKYESDKKVSLFSSPASHLGWFFFTIMSFSLQSSINVTHPNTEGRNQPEMRDHCSTVGMAESYWDQMVIHKGWSVIPRRNALVEAINHMDDLSDGNGWHSEYLAFGRDEQPAQAAEKFGTIWDLFRANNLLLFLFYEVDNLESMACLVISCPKEGKWVSLFLWCSVFLHYIMVCPVALCFSQCFGLAFIFSNLYHNSDICLRSLTLKLWG